MGTISVRTTPEQVAFMDDLKATLARHAHLSAVEMLAVSAQFVGNLSALQDASRYTAEQVFDLISSNIETGNGVAIASVVEHSGGMN